MSQNRVNSMTIASLSPNFPFNFREQRDGVERDSAAKFAQKIAIIKDAQSDARPFMVMDTGRVSDALEKWHRCLPTVQPFFSLQCNPNGVLMEQLIRYPELEVGFNCTTRADMRLALNVVSPQRLLYTSPIGYTRSSLQEARGLQVELLAFESLADLNRISLNHSNAELILNVGAGTEMDDETELIDRAEELLQLAADMNCHCVGIGLSSFEDAYRVDSYPKALEICHHLFQFGRKAGLPLRLINLGDIGHSGAGEEFEVEADAIKSSLDRLFTRENFPNLRVVATPSRFFCEKAFSLATRIVAYRQIDANLVTGDDFDAGRGAHLYEINDGFCGTFGCVDTTAEDGLVGRTCNPLFPNPADELTESSHSFIVLGSSLDAEWDLLYRDSSSKFRPLKVGDWLIWDNMGAYSLNNVTSLVEGEEDESFIPSVFYFSANKEWTRIQGAASRGHRLDARCRSPADSIATLCDDGRGSSLGSEDGVSSECGAGRTSYPSEVDSEPIDEEVDGRGQWVLDWLHNEFNQ